MARVIATQRGHDGFTVREVGEAFDVPDERLKEGSTWFVDAKDAPKAPAPSPEDQPTGAGPVRGSKIRKQ